MRNLCSPILLTIVIAVTLSSLQASSNPIGDADRDIFNYIHSDIRNDFLDDITPVIQKMGEPQVYLGTCAFLCAFGNEKMYETGKLASIAFVEAGAVTYFLKQTIGRPRPLDNDLSETDSFPSGHSTFAFALATVAGWQYKKLSIPLYTLAFGTAFSRIYLGRHYPSDVLVGAAIGTLAGIHILYFKRTVLSMSF